MNRKRLYAFFAIYFMLIGIGCSNNHSPVLVGDVDTSNAVNLTSVNEFFTFTTQGYAFTMDKKGFIYLVDHNYQRILKREKKENRKKFVGQAFLPLNILQ